MAKLAPTRKSATVEQVVPNGVVVRHGTDLGEIEWLTGVRRPDVTLKVGDKGTIVYHVRGSMGGWFWEI
jgi:hypothetical protein